MRFREDFGFADFEGGGFRGVRVDFGTCSSSESLSAVVLFRRRLAGVLRGLVDFPFVSKEEGELFRSGGGHFRGCTGVFQDVERTTF